MKIQRRSFGLAFALQALLGKTRAQTTIPQEPWVFESRQARVLFIPDRGVYLPAVEVKQEFDADCIIVTAFYYDTHTIEGEKLLLSATSIAPYVGIHGAGGGDPMRLPVKPEFVRLKVLKTVTEIEIGRKEKS